MTEGAFARRRRIFGACGEGGFDRLPAGEWQTMRAAARSDRPDQTGGIVHPLPVPDTIAAIATPPGRGGVGVVRVSGAGVPAIIAGIVQRALAPRAATLVDVSRCRRRSARPGPRAPLPGAALVHRRARAGAARARRPRGAAAAARALRRAGRAACARRASSRSARFSTASWTSRRRRASPISSMRRRRRRRARPREASPERFRARSARSSRR